ncbi:ABC transporter permease [Wukongibacter baidiensis]|uniref:ABC transporter permease n=1 Tax=Wukongibacter baidiensis TaxID=1723361 RepID=UPI003D7F3D80
MSKVHNTLFGSISVIGGWYLLHWFIDPIIIPSPYESILNTIDLILYDDLLKHALYSLYRLLSAVGLALLIGVIVGIVLGVNNKADQIISPSIYILFPIPKAAFLPILFALFGLGDQSKIFLIFIILIFQVIVTIRGAVKNLSKDLFLSAKSLGLSTIEIYRHIILPGISPSILTSLRLNVGIGIAVLFFSETYATKYGIGYYIMDKWSLIEYVDMYSGIVVLSLIGYLLFRITDFAEKSLCGWAKK